MDLFGKGGLNIISILYSFNPDLTRIGEATRNREVWRNLIVSTLMEERKEDTRLMEIKPWKVPLNILIYYMS